MYNSKVRTSLLFSLTHLASSVDSVLLEMQLEYAPMRLAGVETRIAETMPKMCMLHMTSARVGVIQLAASNTRVSAIAVLFALHCSVICIKLY